jgi:hypothetical protein
VKLADPEAPLPDQLAQLDELQWWTFVCTGCGETTWIGQDPAQDLNDFASMCRLVLGEPPVCAPCRYEQRAS